jgi:hypothetical protein
MPEFIENLFYMFAFGLGCGTACAAGVIFVLKNWGGD